MQLIGPFQQILTLKGLPLSGPLFDESLVTIKEGGIVIKDRQIVSIGLFSDLKKQYKNQCEVFEIQGPAVLLPGLIDAHTHICYAGSRARDYAMRVEGASYLDIAKLGGGILDTVSKTRQSSKNDLSEVLFKNSDYQLQNGITTCEVKSGYGLTLNDELKMLEAIQEVNNRHSIDLISSCLAAHVLPKEFTSHKKYLDYVSQEILPAIQKKNLSTRVDVFVEEEAFDYDLAKTYLEKAKAMGFSLVVHADQFTVGGSRLACEMGAVSADHLEVSGEAEIEALAKANVIATVLPGSSLGLGLEFAPARKFLDRGCSVVIASDWNPGSAPMGELLLQAAVLGAKERLSMLETFAGLTFRAAKALELDDRGVLESGKMADMIAFPCSDYREILYYQGRMKPNFVWKKGQLVYET